jgi:hypothetical protein
MGKHGVCRATDDLTMVAAFTDDPHFLRSAWMPVDDVCSEIRQAVVARCDSYQFGDPWEFLPTHDDVRCLPGDPAGMLTSLREKYSEEVLLEAGVAQIDEGVLRVRAKLNAPGEVAVVVRDRQHGTVIDILTESGSVFDEDLPVFTASASEQLLLMPDYEHHEVLAAFSIKDLAVLRACGIPATLAVGLDSLHPADLDRLCETFQLDRSKSRRLDDLEIAEEDMQSATDPLRRYAEVEMHQWDWHSNDDCRDGIQTESSEPQPSEAARMNKRLVLLGWSPATLDIDPPVGYTAVEKHFRELEQHMGLSLFEVCSWLPNSDDMTRLQYLMRCEDAARAREALLDCLYDRMHGFDHLRDKDACQVLVPKNFLDAVLLLRETVLDGQSDNAGADRRRESLRHVERLLHEEVIRPMMSEAMEAPGAMERAIRLAATQLVQIFLTEGLVINAQVANTLSRKGIAGLDALPLDEIKRLLEMGDRVTKLFREIDRCTESTVSVIQVTAAPQSRPLALPNSA